MRNQASFRILALVALAALFELHCSHPNRASLRLKARPGSPPGDSTPLAGVTLHLLDIDPIDLVVTGVEDHTPHGERVYQDHPRLKELANLMNARRQAAYSLGPDVFLFLSQSRPLWEPRVIKSAQTDAEGNARLDGIKPGSYRLIGYIEAPGREAFWDRQVAVDEGDNEVVLESSNALHF